MSQKKRGLGRGLGDLGLRELLNDMNAPAAPAQTPTPTSTQQSQTHGEQTIAEKAAEKQKQAKDHMAATISQAVLKTESTIEAPTTAKQNITSPQATPQDNHLTELAIDLIVPGRYQPRKHFDEQGLQELADSINAQGVIQPIVVRKQLNNQYEIIAGERRWRAAQLAQLQTIPAIVRNISDEAAIAMALIENIQRRDLNPIEESVALQRLIDEFQMTHQEVAEAVGKSRTGVTNLLRLQKLNPDVREFVEKGQLEMGHARALLAIEGIQQSAVAKQVIARHLSVRETEALIRRFHQQKNASGAAQTKIDPDIARLQQDISEKLAAKVLIQHTAKGKGRLVIAYNSLDELDGILDHIQ